jgi:hypothetical protein
VKENIVKEKTEEQGIDDTEIVDIDDVILDQNHAGVEYDHKDKEQYFIQFQRSKKQASNIDGDKRVHVTAIEFDWIFTKKEGKAFLWNLAKTENLDFFDIPVIQNVINYQWKFF